MATVPLQGEESVLVSQNFHILKSMENGANARIMKEPRQVVVNGSIRLLSGLTDDYSRWLSHSLNSFCCIFNLRDLARPS